MIKNAGKINLFLNIQSFYFIINFFLYYIIHCNNDIKKQFSNIVSKFLFFILARIKLGKSVFFKRGSTGSKYLALVENLVVLEGLSFFSFI